jgi:hypothetical protein
MLAHYSNVRLNAKRNPLDALTMGKGKEGNSERTSKGYDTNNDTKVPSRSIQMPHVIDYLVELDGLELSTSSLLCSSCSREYHLRVRSNPVALGTVTRQLPFCRRAGFDCAM